MISKLLGLVAATHTPFTSDGQLNLAVVEKQAEHLLQNGVRTAFIGGTTGESHSLTVEERLALAKRWSEVVQGMHLKLIVHVGSNCLADARTLAAQAQNLKASAISAVAPSYFKPRTVNDLVACCEQIARAAPEVPFYHYDIPSMTGLHLSMPEFLTLGGERIATLAGIKFSNPDLMMFQRCLHVQEGKFDIPWGVDEYLMSALAVGAVGGVGSTYNFAAALYQRILIALSKNDQTAARREQYRSVQIVELLSSFGYMAAAKAVMGFLGVDVGPPRLPNPSLTGEQRNRLRQSLERLGFFEWIR